VGARSSLRNPVPETGTPPFKTPRKYVEVGGGGALFKKTQNNPRIGGSCCVDGVGRSQFDVLVMKR